MWQKTPFLSIETHIKYDNFYRPAPIREILSFDAGPATSPQQRRRRQDFALSLPFRCSPTYRYYKSNIRCFADKKRSIGGQKGKKGSNQNKATIYLHLLKQNERIAPRMKTFGTDFA
jgi:hypothetical protein